MGSQRPGTKRLKGREVGRESEKGVRSGWRRPSPDSASGASWTPW